MGAWFEGLVVKVVPDKSCSDVTGTDLDGFIYFVKFEGLVVVHSTLLV